MHSLDIIHRLNTAAEARCAHCDEPRQTLEASGKFLARYEVLNSESEAEALLCDDCVLELADTDGACALKRIG
jgi:hypothetical protein